MSEYWKSTPKYWCKHCGIYVRDTKLERTNHEATGKHQGALKRFLRDLHRGHEQEQREKDRARREIERLNGIVPTASSSSSATAAPPRDRNHDAQQQSVTKEDRQRQWEQLVDLGVEVPTELRGEMAMAGEWTVTNTRVIEDEPRGSEGDDGADEKKKNVDAVATGVRKKRPLSNRDGDGDGADEEAAAEEDAAVQGLFKKPRRWGRDTRHAPGADEDDAELDALLSGTLVVPKKEGGGGDADGAREEEGDKIKLDPGSGTAVKEEEGNSMPRIKKEEDEEGSEGRGLENVPKDTSDVPASAASVKTEEQPADPGPAVPAVVFKKRKPKNVRQK